MKPIQLVPWLKGEKEKLCKASRLLQKDVPLMGVENTEGQRYLRKQEMISSLDSLNLRSL